MKKRRRGLVVVVIIAIVGVLFGTIIYIRSDREKHKDGIQTSTNEMQLKGEAFPWNGCYRIIRADNSDLQLSFEKDTQTVKASSMSGGYANDILYDWIYDGEKITFAILRNAYNEIYVLEEIEEGNLSGTCQYMSRETAVILEKYRDTANTKEQSNQDMKRSGKEQVDLLNAYSEYKTDELVYDYTYDLNQKELYRDFINTYELDRIAEGKSDIELMMALMNWLCDMCKHGSTAYYESSSIDEIVTYGKENGLNCRCLSLVLSEVMRMYGIKAKVIWCYPKDDYFDDCHVVVQAYSEETKQWIMFDPTYRLTLQTKTGEYMDIQGLREWIRAYGYNLEDMTPESSYYLVSNEEAGYTGNTEYGFNLKDYANYMAKNLFRLKCLSENTILGTKCFQNTYTIELIPTNYNIAGIELFEANEIDLSGKYVYTTDVDKFFELPE